MDFASTLPQTLYLSDRPINQVLWVDVNANASPLWAEIAIQWQAKTNWVEIQEYATERLNTVHNLH